MKGKCVTIEHPHRFKGGTQGGGHSTGGGSGTSRSSYSSSEQHIQQVCTYLGVVQFIEDIGLLGSQELIDHIE